MWYCGHVVLRTCNNVFYNVSDVKTDNCAPSGDIYDRTGHREDKFMGKYWIRSGRCAGNRRISGFASGLADKHRIEWVSVGVKIQQCLALYETSVFDPRDFYWNKSMVSQSINYQKSEREKQNLKRRPMFLGLVGVWVSGAGSAGSCWVWEKIVGYSEQYAEFRKGRVFWIESAVIFAMSTKNYELSGLTTKHWETAPYYLDDECAMWKPIYI
ncbi:hypothetical protein C8R48DRAFT_669548 [Suillus tomentosus]|nr:hypothetical protein C8R48DRAFT_669548 [Suillus tomentosus]